MLNTTVTQVNNHTDIELNYQQHKKSRIIIGFSFHF
ncbi:hypothetical protein [Candidatus Nitrosacidococcus tergens]